MPPWVTQLPVFDAGISSASQQLSGPCTPTTSDTSQPEHNIPPPAKNQHLQARALSSAVLLGQSCAPCHVVRPTEVLSLAVPRLHQLLVLQSMHMFCARLESPRP
jgi:hypothetical protein